MGVRINKPITLTIPNWTSWFISGLSFEPGKVQSRLRMKLLTTASEKEIILLVKKGKLKTSVKRLKTQNPQLNQLTLRYRNE